MLQLCQILLALLIVVVLPLADRRQLAGLQADSTMRLRLKAYRRGAVLLWSAAVAALALDSAGQPLTGGSFMVPAWLHAYGSLPAQVLALAAGVWFSLVLGQGAQCAFDAMQRRRIAAAFTRLQFILPVTKPERRWWILLSLSAGIGEEVLYRGYLFRCLTGQLEVGLQLDPSIAWLLCSIAFGTAHMYQGWRGVAAASVTGLLLGLVALLTDSLLWSMLIHVLLDLQILWMYRPALDDPAQAQRLIGGAAGLAG